LLINIAPAFAQATANDNDAVLKAMNDELTRSVNKLQIKDLDKPYFIEYELLDADVYSLTASFGGVVYSNRNRSRVLSVDVRVGSYDFDNEPMGMPRQMPIEDDYAAIRHELWLATDTSYRQAVEQLSRKRAFLRNRVSVEDEKIPDFSKEEPTVAINARRTIQFNENEWQQRVREWSAIFRQFPAIKQSGVSFQVQLTHKYLVNSEGTRIRRPSLLVTLEAYGSAQAADGMWLGHSVPFYALSIEEMPAPQQIAAAIKQMAEELTKLQSAPIFAENYVGPVLMTGQASAEMFSQLLAPELCSLRAPVGMSSGEDKSELANRINRIVLPSSFTVFDDPTQQRVGNQSLIGTFDVDDQGVPARRVSLVEQGVLKTLLLSRRPRKDMFRSNGHGRSAAVGYATTQIGNLFIQATQGKSYDELKQELIKMCKAQSMTYGIIIKHLNSRGGSGLSDPVLAYKVYVEDGREELIRGASTGDLTVRQLRQIEAIGNDSFVHNQIEDRGGMFGGLGVGTTVVAPSVLLEELEMKKPTGMQQKPMLLTHPYFDKP
ncbi:MAG TPA: metallopeptidase TldD-related protein, partial [Blastocatellia bacterium]|nr:metallopeptidase TldD-related protein [Blastocatellia bacterium]